MTQVEVTFQSTLPSGVTPDHSSYRVVRCADAGVLTQVCSGSAHGVPGEGWGLGEAWEVPLVLAPSLPHSVTLGKSPVSVPVSSSGRQRETVPDSWVISRLN